MAETEPRRLKKKKVQTEDHQAAPQPPARGHRLTCGADINTSQAPGGGAAGQRGPKATGHSQDCRAHLVSFPGPLLPGPRWLSANAV